jgi:hypothetical protein
MLRYIKMKSIRREIKLAWPCHRAAHDPNITEPMWVNKMRKHTPEKVWPEPHIAFQPVFETNMQRAICDDFNVGYVPIHRPTPAV